jgi:DHA1 family inner membrane transport protein
MPISIYALTLFGFTIGAAEFVIAGILPYIASNLNVSLPQAGYLVSAYAGGVFIFAPIAALVIIKLKLPNKTALLYLAGAFLIGNLMSALANDYSVLMLGRIIASIAHGAGFGIGAVLASSLVSKEKANMAIAIMFAGLTVANVLGVPVGTFIGQAYGWRATFWFVIIFGLLAFLGILFLIKQPKEKTKQPNIRQEIKALTSSPVIFSLLTTCVGWSAVFLILTYINPLMINISGFKEVNLGYILIAYGVAIVFGDLFGAKMADKFPTKSTLILLTLSSITCFVFAYTLNFSALSLATLLIWGFLSFTAVSAFQGRVVKLSSNAPNLSSTFNIAAFNVANMLGSVIANEMVDANLSYNTLPIAAGTLGLIGVALLLYSVYLEKKAKIVSI